MLAQFSAFKTDGGSVRKSPETPFALERQKGEGGLGRDFVTRRGGIQWPRK